MTRPKRPVLQIAMTDTQMDMLDFLLKIVHHDRFSKTSYILEYIRSDIRNYLSLPDEIGLTDEQLLNMAIDCNERRIISFIGEEKYHEFLNHKESEEDE